MMRISKSIPVILLVGLLAVPSWAAGNWRDAKFRQRLQTDTLQATFQSGLLCELKDRKTGQWLIRVDADQLPAERMLFGKAHPFDLDRAEIKQQRSPHSVSTQWKDAAGAVVDLQWSLDPDSGGLVLRMSARTPFPVAEMRMTFFGCDMEDHRLVTVSNLGEGKVLQGEGNGAFRGGQELVLEGGVHVQSAVNGFFRGDPEKDDYSKLYVHPLIAMFEGDDSGWVIEGRDLKIGPANLMAKGSGKAVHVGFIRGFAPETPQPEMFEIRIRAYHGAWQDAVDPYVEWMQNGLGFTPLEQKSPAWVNDIESQASLIAGDMEGLDLLAARLVPSKTFLGRSTTYRNHQMDVNWPDYHVSEPAKAWIKRAKELGFRVGVHVNATGIDPSFTDLVERFRPGFLVTGKDEQGKDTYWYAEGLRHYYCSAAYKPWRDFLIEQLREIVESGVDVIHLDEAHTPTGQFLIDGVTAIEGMMLLEKELLQAYPQIAIQTEQFNPMASRYASFSLSPWELGHPLSGYIFNRFQKTMPEGFMYSPTDEQFLSAMETWGFMYPGADARREESWLQIARAFQDHQLKPAPRLKRNADQLSGFQGAGGVTAFYEKKPTQRGLVVYEPNQPPKWVGTRHFGISEWPGPGAIKGWLIYDGDALMGLDPTKTYAFDEAVKLPPQSFHISKVFKGFQARRDLYLDFGPGEAGQDAAADGLFYRIKCLGTGPIELVVPEGYLAFVDAAEAQPHADTRIARAQINGSEAKPSVVRCFRQSETPLIGKVVDLPWQVPPRQRTGHATVRDDGFAQHVSGMVILVGRLPQASRLRIQGSYGMRQDSMMSAGDGVIRINGREVLRVPHGERPFPMTSFDVDITEFAGQPVMIELVSDGEVRAWAMADWLSPQIVVDP